MNVTDTLRGLLDAALRSDLSATVRIVDDEGSHVYELDEIDESDGVVYLIMGERDQDDGDG